MQAEAEDVIQETPIRIEDNEGTISQTVVVETTEGEDVIAQVLRALRSHRTHPRRPKIYISNVANQATSLGHVKHLKK